MKELLTLKEAASLAGRTTKTIKNYIKRGKITNFFLVEGKYGQEYRINVKDIQPLVKAAGKSSSGKGGVSSGKQDNSYDNNVLQGKMSPRRISMTAPSTSSSSGATTRSSWTSGAAVPAWKIWSARTFSFVRSWRRRTC